MTGPRRFTPDDRLAVRDRFAIEVEVGKRVKLQRKGSRYLGLCPFHAEKTPSFEVSPQKGTFRCFGCGSRGDVVEWEMRTQNVGYPEAMRRLMEDGGLTDTEAAKEAADRRRKWEERLEREAAERRAREMARAREIWEGAEDITDDPGRAMAEAYFESRGLRLKVTAFRRVLRFVPVLRYWVEDHEIDGGVRLAGMFPALIALIQDCRTTAPIGIHVTYLNSDGTKLEAFDPKTGEQLDARKIRGARDGGAIMLCRPRGEYLGFAEGWETALSVLQATLGFEEGHRFRALPVWAAVSLGNLGGGALGRGDDHPDPERAAKGQRLPSTKPDPNRPGVLPPAGVAHPVLLEDGDSGDLPSAEADGTRAINRWLEMGRRPLRFRAPVGCDFNDLIKGGEDGGDPTIQR